MCTFAWMFVEGLHIYRMLTEVRNINHGHMRFYYAISWGVPALITGDTYTHTHTHTQTKQNTTDTKPHYTHRQTPTRTHTNTHIARARARACVCVRACLPST